MLGYLGYDDAKLRKKMKLYKISAETGCQKKGTALRAGN